MYVYWASTELTSEKKTHIWINRKMAALTHYCCSSNAHLCSSHTWVLCKGKPATERFLNLRNTYWHSVPFPPHCLPMWVERPSLSSSLLLPEREVNPLGTVGSPPCIGSGRNCTESRGISGGPVLFAHGDMDLVNLTLSTTCFCTMEEGHKTFLTFWFFLKLLIIV